MTENMQADSVQSRQAGFVRCCLNAIEETRIKVMPFLVKFFDSYSSLEGMYDLGDKMIPGFYEDVVIILQRIDEYIDIKDAEFSDTLKNAMSTLGNNPMMRMVA